MPEAIPSHDVFRFASQLLPPVTLVIYGIDSVRTVRGALCGEVGKGVS